MKKKNIHIDTNIEPADLDYWMNKTPDISLFPKIDLNFELKRNNVVFAYYIILFSLIKGTNEIQDEILRNIKIEYFYEKSFEQYLFTIIKDKLFTNEAIEINTIKKQIPNFGIKYYGRPSSPGLLIGLHFEYYQILYLQPTIEQTRKAIELIITKAKREGVY